MIVYLIAGLFGYLLGSIPFGLVLAQLGGYGDIRKIGSGNIGATNVLRTGNKPLALATLLLDSGKGAIAVLIYMYFWRYFYGAEYSSPVFENKHDEYLQILPELICLALGAVLGHCYPIWLKFKGGKGVATTLGTLLALAWPIGLSACAVWFVSALVFRISSLSALIAVGVTPIIAHFIYDNPNLSGFCAIIAALIYIKHRENIKRIIAGTEPKIGKKEKAE